MLTVGSQGLYEWMVTDRPFDVLQICPEVVAGKYVAITSIDSSELVPSENEKASGWENRGRIAYSPKVQDIKSLPREWYDEWYVFIDPVDLGISHLAENIFEVPQERGHVSVFVNYGGFALDRPVMKDLAALFWQQIDWIRPQSYIADGDYLNFVSMNQSLFARVHDAVRALR